MISCEPQPNQALQASPSEAEERQQDSKEETYVGKYLASWQWQSLDSIGTIWRDLRVYLLDLLGIFRSCQGRGREFESRFPLQVVLDRSGQNVRIRRYSTAYPSARALSLTRASRVRKVTSWGGSPSDSAVARWTASRVRIGSTGKGRPARASTDSVTETMSQRRLNVCSQRSAARSSAGVNRAVTRARTRARAVSANVKADVMRRPGALSAFLAAMSCSSRAASKALDSTYRNPAAASAGATAGAGVARRSRRLALRLATVAVDQLSCCASRSPDFRPFCGR